MKKYWLASALAFPVLFGIFWFWHLPQERFSSVRIRPDNVHYALYGNPEFYTGLQDSDSVAAIEDRVYGGIVSHHFFMERKIAEFFLQMKKQRPKVVVVIGPNHFHAGQGNMLLSEYPYETPWGLLDSNKKITTALLQGGIVRAEEKPFEQEHAISALAGFVKYTFPDTTFVPVILKRTASAAEADRLGETLAALLPKDSLVIASVDFSHHLNRIAADFHDDKSIESIRGFRMDELEDLEVDSPQSLRAVLRYLQARGAEKFSFQRTNSATAVNNLDSEDVTSYVFGHFLSGEQEDTGAVSLLHFGDMMLGRAVGAQMEKGMNPFEQIAGVEGNFFRGVDGIVANLEGPIAREEICERDAGITFLFPPATARFLKKNKIWAVNVANNHTEDCGRNGFADTKNYLDDSDVFWFGDLSVTENSYRLRDIDGRRIAWLGINALWWSEEEAALALTLVEKAEKESDYTIVNIHWGVEYAALPSAEQIRIARALVDRGADVVIGHHPHVIQPMEIYRGRPIFYSLGNFIFDQEPPETNQGLGVGTILFEKAMRVYLFPFRIKHSAPELFSYSETERFCDEFLPSEITIDTCRFDLPF